MDRLKRIVSLLNGPPHHIEVTLYDIESKSESELLRFLGSLTSGLGVSIPLQDLLRISACPIALDSNSRSNLYDVLAWLAEHLSVISKSKPIYKQLEPVVVPGSVLTAANESLNGLLERIAEHQTVLTDIFIRFLEADSHCARMQSVEAHLRDLNVNESVLSEKITKARRKMRWSKGFEEILKRTIDIRVLSGEIETWTDRDSELNTMLSNLQHSLQEDTFEVDLMSEIVEKHSGRMLEAMRLKSKEFRSVLNNDVGELDKAQAMRDKLEVLLSKSGTRDTEILMMEEKIQLLSKDTEDKRNQLTLVDPSITAHEKMLPYYQQYKLTRNKHYALLNDRMKLELEHKRSTQRLRREEAEYLARTGSNFVPEEDLNSLVGLVRERGLDYKRLRTLNAELDAEREVIEATLKKLDADLKALVSSAECATLSLEEVSAQAGEINSSKEAVLNELSTIAKEIAVKLRAREAVLGPKLADMERRQEELDSLNDKKLHIQETLDRAREPFRIALSHQESEKQQCMQTLSGVLNDLGNVQSELDRIKALRAEIDTRGAITRLQQDFLAKQSELRILERRLHEAESTRNSQVHHHFKVVIAALQQRQGLLGSFSKSRQLNHIC